MIEEKIVKQSITKKRRGNPQWLRGESGNPNGRPRKPEIEELRLALELAEKTHNKSFLEHFIDRAFVNDQVAIALAKKLLPDKLQGEGFASTNITIIKTYGKEKETEIRPDRETNKSIRLSN